MTTVARIRQHGDKQMWTCPECSRIMGELTSSRLVVIIRKYQHVSFRLADGMEMTCPYCHAVSCYRFSPAFDTLSQIDPSAAR